MSSKNGNKSAAGNVNAATDLPSVGQNVKAGNVEGVARDVNLSDIHVKVGFNMRHFFSQPELEALAASLKSVGQLSSIVVAERSDGKGYWLVAGEKRTRAARMAGLTKLRATVIAEADAERAAIDENFRRADVSMPDRCMFVKGRRDAGKTNDEIAAELGLSPQTTSNDYSVVTKLHPSIFEQWAQKPGASKVVLSLAGKPQAEQLAAWAYYCENGKLPRKEGDTTKPGKGQLERAYASATLARDYCEGRSGHSDARAFFMGVAFALEFVAGQHVDATDGEVSWPEAGNLKDTVAKAKAPPKQTELFGKAKTEPAAT